METTFNQNFISSLGELDRQIEIVNIGASFLTGDESYKPLVDHGLCRVTGFEPNPVEHKKLEEMKIPHSRFFPHAIGDGKELNLNITQTPGFTSGLKPRISLAAAMHKWFRHIKIVESISLPTKKLDDVLAGSKVDFLKIDIQGGELKVFQHAKKILKDALVVQTEVCFSQIYENQPTIGVQDTELRKYGFTLIDIIGMQRFTLAGPKDPRITNRREQLINARTFGGVIIDADAIYAKDFVDYGSTDTNDLKRLALIFHFCFKNPNYVIYILNILEARKEIETGATDYYLMNHRNP